MKWIVLILLLIFGCNPIIKEDMAVYVPDTNTFCLDDVIDAVEDHAGNISNDLDACFDYADSDYFDPLYNDSEYAPTNSMKRFRNYGPPDDSVSCGVDKEYNGDFVYPYRVNIDLGTGTGWVTLYFDSFSLPELYLVHYDGEIVINTAFRGHADFDYGGSLRYSVINTLNGRVDPVYGNTFPDYSHYPDDGYPRVLSPGNGSADFYKSSSNEIAKVEVWSAVDDITQWEFRLSCPV
jgi:hypothetical protein